MEVFQPTTDNRAYPPDTGGYQRTHGLVSAFCLRDDRVERFCCSGPVATYYQHGELLDRRIEIGENLVEERHYSPVHDVPKVFKEIGYTGLLWSKALERWTGKELLERAEKHDVVIGDLYTARYIAEHSDVPTLYSSHNVEYERYRSTVEKPFSSPVADRLEKYEAKTAETVDAVICTTESDSKEYERYTDSTIVVPNGVPIEKFETDTEVEDRAAYGISESDALFVFLGSDYGPNVDAVNWLIDNWDSLRSDHHLLVVGNVGDTVETDLENVHTAGYVADLQSTLAMADVALNPVTSGGGSNIKLIEYFAAELPVISTPFGSQGFDLDDGSNALVRKRPAFSESMTTLADDNELLEKLARNGHQLGKERYTWEELSEDLRRTVRERFVQ